MNKLSVQILTYTPEAFEFVKIAQPSYLKVLDIESKLMDGASYIQALCSLIPDLRVIFRHYRHPEDQKLDLKESDRFADDLLRRLDSSQVRDYIYAVEGYNETGLWDDGPLYSEWTKQFAKRMRREGLKSIAYNFSTGNPPEMWLWKDYLEGLAESDFLGLHEYGAPSVLSDKGWQSLRYRKVYEEFPRELQNKPLFITECGIDSGNIGVLPNKGYKYFGMGDETYTSQLNELADEWDKDQVECGFVFCCGSRDPAWGTFDTSHNKSLAIAISKRNFQLRKENMPITPSSLYTDWLAQGGSGHREDFILHLYKIGADYSRPDLYGVPQLWEEEDREKDDIVLPNPFRIELTRNAEDHRPITRGIVIHSTGGQGSDAEVEYRKTIDYFLYMGSNSAHFVIGPHEVTRMAYDDEITYHAKENNLTHIGIELAQTASGGLITDFQYKALALIVSKLGNKYKIPMKRVMSQNESGLIGHKDTEQGKREGKIDPQNFNWDRFLKLLSPIQLELIPMPYDIGMGFTELLQSHSECGLPLSAITHDVMGNGYVWTTKGFLLVWNKSRNQIKVMDWNS